MDWNPLKSEMTSDGDEPDDALNDFGLDITETMEALSTFKHLNAIVMGTDWILIQRDQFDVFLEHQPYQTMQIIVNLINKLYLIRVWGKTQDQGIITSTRELKTLCIKMFDYTSVCKGIAEQINDEVVPVDYPLRRFVSQRCEEMFQMSRVSAANCAVSLCVPCSLQVRNAKGRASTKDQKEAKFDSIDIKTEPISLECDVQLGEEEYAPPEDDDFASLDRLARGLDDRPIDCPTPAAAAAAAEKTVDRVTLSVGSIDYSEETSRKIAEEIESLHKQRARANVQKKRIAPVAKTKKKKKVLRPYKDLTVKKERLLCKCGKFADKLSEETEGERVEEMFHCVSCNTKFKRVKMLVKKTTTTAAKPAPSSAAETLPKKSYTCKVCGLVTYNLSDYLDHHQTHAAERPKEPKPFQCSKCSESYETEKRLENHIRIYHGDGVRRKKAPKSSKVPPKLVIDPSVAIFMCEECGEEVPNNAKDINKHMNTKHSDLTCDICDKTFGNRSGLNQHKALHKEPDFPCPTCGKLFKTKGKAKMHEDRVHFKSDRINKVCEICHHTYTNLVGFNVHLKNKHPEAMHLMLYRGKKRAKKNKDKVEERKKEEEVEKKKEKEEDRYQREQEEAIASLRNEAQHYGYYQHPGTSSGYLHNWNYQH